MEDSVLNLLNLKFFPGGGGRDTVYIAYVPTFQRNQLLPSISIVSFFEVLSVGVDL
jgi:hypothetical protein